MITASEYFGRWFHETLSADVRHNGDVLLAHVNPLLDHMRDAHGIVLPINPKTKSNISGTQYGGFRPQDCPEGAPSSAHKTGEAVDVYDPDGHLDDAITDEILTRFGLYREHPSATRGWCHLSTRSPKSGKRTFYP